MNYGSILLDTAGRVPDAVAIKTDSGSTDFATFGRRVTALAAALRDQGFGRGDGLAVWIDNRPEFLEAVTAAWVRGGYVVPINPRLNAQEATFQLQDSEARALVSNRKLLTPEAKAVVEAGAALLSTTIVVGGDVEDGELDYGSLVESNLDAAIAPVDTGAEELMWLFYTSGTTGQPKGVMWSHRTFGIASALTAADLVSARPGDGVLIAGPASHGAGHVALFGMSRGATASFTPLGQRPTPALILRSIEEHRPTSLFLTPTHIKMLIAEPDFASFDLSSLASIIYGGSAMLVEDLRQALAAFGDVDLIQIYGQGECCTVITALSAEDHRRAAGGDDPTLTRRLASAGQPRSLTEVAIFADDGSRSAAGEIGEIAVRGPATGCGYWRSPAATRETFREDGWVMTGDLGRIEEDGFLYILDRKKDMIVSGGMNIYAREVEDALLEHPAVSECAVIAIPHPVFGESVCAVVVTATEVPPEELTSHVVGQIAEFKKPQRYVFVDELPKNPTGKIQKAELRKRYASGAQ